MSDLKKIKKIAVLDTGKEWGGGTNSLIELLKRIDRSKYAFTAFFYYNYRMGSGADVRSTLEGLGVQVEALARARRRAYIKALKEAGRAFLSASPKLKKKLIFKLDYAERILPSARIIEKALRDMGADALYMNNQPSSNLEGIIAAKKLGIPCLQHCRVDVALNEFETKAVNASVNAVICVSDGVRKTLLASGVTPSKCTVVYNGIDSDVRAAKNPMGVRKSLGLSGSDFVVGTVGSLIKRKRVDIFIKAFAELKTKAKKCVIVGDGPEMARLKAETERLGMKGSVIFTGFSPDAISYINAMDVFVLPSEKEGLPRVILESMLMGVPAVAFNVVGPSELIIDGKTGILVNDETPSTLARAIDGMAESKGMIEEMGRAARERVVKDFGIDRYVAGVEAVFSKVL